jgi:hypothetical protein
MSDVLRTWELTQAGRDALEEYAPLEQICDTVTLPVGDFRPPDPSGIDQCRTTGYYHGGPAGFQPGMELLPRNLTGVEPSATRAARAAGSSPNLVDVDQDDGDWVFVSRHPWIAMYSTRRHWPSAVYEVRPQGARGRSRCAPIGEFSLPFERGVILGRRWGGLTTVARQALVRLSTDIAQLPTQSSDDALTFYNHLSIGVALLRKRDYGLPRDLVRTLISVWSANQAFLVLGLEGATEWWKATIETEEGRSRR